MLLQALNILSNLGHCHGKVPAAFPGVTTFKPTEGQDSCTKVFTIPTGASRCYFISASAKNDDPDAFGPNGDVVEWGHSIWPAFQQGNGEALHSSYNNLAHPTSLDLYVCIDTPIKFCVVMDPDVYPDGVDVTIKAK